MGGSQWQIDLKKIATLASGRFVMTTHPSVIASDSEAISFFLKTRLPRPPTAGSQWQRDWKKRLPRPPTAGSQWQRDWKKRLPRPPTAGSQWQRNWKKEIATPPYGRLAMTEGLEKEIATAFLKGSLTFMSIGFWWVILPSTSLWIHPQIFILKPLDYEWDWEILNYTICPSFPNTFKETGFVTQFKFSSLYPLSASKTFTQARNDWETWKREIGISSFSRFISCIF